MKRFNLLVSEEMFNMVYWKSRYQNIHRLITHCSNPPKKQFIAKGYMIIKVEEKKNDNRTDKREKRRVGK